MKGSKYLIFFMFLFSNNLSGWVVFLTGPSASGKTSILNEFKKMNLNCECLSYDGFVREEFKDLVKLTKVGTYDSYKEYLLSEQGKKDLHVLEAGSEIVAFDKFKNKVLKLASENKNIVCEALLSGNKSDLRPLFNLLLKVKTFFVLVYCPFDSLIEFVKKRNKEDETGYYWRSFSNVVQQFCDYYELGNSNDRFVGMINDRDVQRSCDNALKSIDKNIEIEDMFIKVKKQLFKKFDISQEESLTDNYKNIFSVFDYDCFLRNEWGTDIQFLVNLIIQNVNNCESLAVARNLRSFNQ